MSGGTKQAGAVRKRQQISDSSKQMFMWVAGMSAIVGAALVVSWFVWQQVISRDAVIEAKNKTAATLTANNDAVPMLRDNIRALDTNTGLNESKALDEHRALQAILDALPAVFNPLALGASIERNLAVGIDGLRLVSLTPVGSFGGLDSSVDSAVASAEGDGSGAAQQVAFTMTVEANSAAALKELLERFERSIRVIDVDEIKMERSASSYTMTITAHGYYQQGKVIEMTDRKLQ